MKRTTRMLVIVLASGWLCACGTATHNISLRHSQSAADAQAAAAIVEEYLHAKTPLAMRQAVEKMAVSHRQSGAYGLIARNLAFWENRSQDSFDLLVEGGRDANSPFALYNFRKLMKEVRTLADRQKVEGLLEEAAVHHPSFEVRALANYRLATFYRARGKLEEAGKVAARNGWRVPLAILGSFDNEQGKGFNIVFPPEKEIDLNATYQGKNVKVGWRTDVPVNLEQIIELDEILYPSRWSVAFGVAAFRSDRDGEYELRISTSDALKVWFNDGLVFSERKLDGWSFDTIVIPISVKKGVNRLLIKSVQDSDSFWNLYARITEQGAKPVGESVFTIVSAGTPPDSRERNDVKTLSGEDLVRAKVSPFKDGSATKMFLSDRFAQIMGLDRVRLEAARSFHESYPDSLHAEFILMLALWDSSERSRTSDMLGKLVADFGDELITVKLKQARFWRQEDLEKKSWQLLLDLTQKHPERPTAFRNLADWYENKEWTEDRCLVLEEVNRKWPGWLNAMTDLADCYEELGMQDKELDIYDQILADLPHHWTSLFEKYYYAMDARDYSGARKILRKMIKTWPNDPSPLQRLGDLERKAGQYEAAKAAWYRQRELAPTSPVAYDKLARMLYFEGDREEAISLWKEALERDPDRGGLSERLSYFAPTATEHWAGDVPSKEKIDAAVESRDRIKPFPGADSLLLLDHMVTELKNDGSTVSVATNVTHSLNQSGRDAIMNQAIGCPGSTKVQKAYSVSPKGEMSEASSIGSSSIRFRGLEVGSTTVVQSRCERSPDSMIGDYFSFDWSFQRPNAQFVDSELILWLPRDMELKEWFQGEVKRQESEQDNYRRISWNAKNTPVFKVESFMPHPSEFAWRLSLSTVPNWGMFQKWEEALLEDAFRKSPEVVELANKLFNGISDPEQKLRKIQSFLATEIRYQMDYENTIAGVKPHPASVILARRYGDCKDKSVLFIVLADLGGIETEFAILRTTKMGVITQEVPSQQFNHAIVYVPEQKGIENARFYDPTADGLDVDVMRADDPGAIAFVLEGDNEKYKWIKIPFQAPEMNKERTEIEMVLNADGAVNGRLKFDYKGVFSAAIRKLARNSELFAKFLQVIVAKITPGSQVAGHEKGDLEDVEKRIALEVTYKNDNFATKRGKELRFTVPFYAETEKMFALEKREHPLLLGVPHAYEWNTEIKLPGRSKISRPPGNFQIQLECLQYNRKVVSTKGKIAVRQLLQFNCDRITPEAYPEYRRAVQKIGKVGNEEVAIVTKK